MYFVSKTKQFFFLFSPKKYFLVYLQLNEMFSLSKYSSLSLSLSLSLLFLFFFTHFQFIVEIILRDLILHFKRSHTTFSSVFLSKILKWKSKILLGQIQKIGWLPKILCENPILISEVDCLGHSSQFKMLVSLVTLYQTFLSITLLQY